MGLVIVAACADERVLPDAGTTDVRVHPAGILDPASAAFHGKELARHDYSFALCASCHGDDFAGGRAKVSCLGCHADGPTACVTCHRDGPTTAAHVVHREVGKLACGECHVVPATWDAEGHILRGGHADPAPAEVTFGARAGATLDPADRAGPPSFDGDRCTNVYCHGGALHAGGGTAVAPRWTEPAPVGTCDRCHGAPPPSHAQRGCPTCHPPSAPHIDGVVQIGRTSGCDGCHGTADSPAPPVDLAGNVFTTALGVGAHRAHLDVPSGLRGPIPCATCHVVPATVSAPGHIDSALPAEVTPSLGWDRASGTCTTAWCHGGARPVWTTSQGPACGSCHGVPPSDASHAPGMPVTACVSCHPRTVDAAGALLFTPGVPSEHIDGDVDVF